MPGVVSRTSTYALTNVTLKYASLIAKLGLEDAISRDAALGKGLNVYGGYVCNEAVARDLNLEYRPYSPR
jgi:alanine dehydrogenase